MIEAKVITCKKNEFEDRYNPGRKVSGFVVAVALPGNNGWVECWSTEERKPGDTVNLEITEGKYHKPKVRCI